MACLSQIVATTPRATAMTCGECQAYAYAPIAEAERATLEETAAALRVTRERARQIEREALARVRRAMMRAGLAADLEAWLAERARRDDGAAMFVAEHRPSELSPIPASFRRSR